MRLSVHLIWMLATVGIGAGQNEGAAEELLTLKPLGTSFERSQGSTIMFTCEISNNKEDVDYSVRWFGDNNGEISDTSGRMYVEDDGLHLRKLYITKIEEADAGTYTCRARINGEQHERQTRLTIFKEITFDNAPSPQNPRIFSNALISCVVSGSPSPQVSWRFNGKRITFSTASASRYALEPGKGLTIMNVTQNDDGEYICRAEVEADGRYAEKKIEVKVQSQVENAVEEELMLKPLATSFERSQGGIIMFSCEISNHKDNVDYSVRWFGDNNGEISFTSGRMYVEDEGLHLKKLYITKIEEGDAGTYTCRATINGEQHERKTRLTIFKDITFDYAPSAQNPRIFSNALISCVVSGSPSPQVSWRFNGKRIDFGKASASRYALEQGKGMTIMNVTQDDDGEYICRAEVNVDGRYGEKKITVKVHIPPSITASPGKVSGVEGQSVTMKCEASGLPKPKYEFIKGKEVLQSTDRVVVDNDAGSVVFTKLVKSDEDQYTCRAINDVDQDTAVGHLHVFVKPEILELTNVTATEAGTATLVCKSRGDPTPDMTFHKVGEQSAYATGENEEGKIVVSQTESMLQLVISDLESTDTGSYVCSARNAHGHHEMTGTLTVNYAPKFVEGQLDEAYSWAGRSSNISCQANGSPAPSIEWLKGDQILSNNEVFHIFDLGTTSYLQITVRESDQSWVYTSYTCKAMNQLNFKEFNIDLKRATAPSSPASVNATKVSPTTAVLSVEQPVEDGGMPVVGYIVEIEGEGEAIDFPAGQPVKLTNLKPDTTYTVSVKAKNEVGASSPSELTFITESTRKPYPIVLTSDPRGAMPYNYKLSWELPDDGGTPIITYQIKLRQVDGLPGLTDWKTVAVEKTPKQAVVQHEFKDLKEQTTYEVEITAKNSIGWSDANDRFTFTTAKATAAAQGQSSAPRIVLDRLSSFISVVCLWTLVFNAAFQA